MPHQTVSLTNVFEDMFKIKDNLYLGNEDAANESKKLVNNKITKVLSIGSNVWNKVNVIEYKFLEIHDSNEELIMKYFNECNKFINSGLNSGNGVLVHCQKGICRSPSIVIGYLMSTSRTTFAMNYEFVKKICKKIEIRSNFKQQLEIFERMSYNIDSNNVYLKDFLLRKYFDSIDIREKIITYNTKVLEMDSESTNVRLTGEPIECIKCFNVFSDKSMLLEETFDENITSCNKSYILPSNWMYSQLINIFENRNRLKINPKLKCIRCNHTVIEMEPKLMSFVCLCPKHRHLKGLFFKLV